MGLGGRVCEESPGPSPTLLRRRESWRLCHELVSEPTWLEMILPCTSLSGTLRPVSREKAEAAWDAGPWAREV